jgi:hypothetical protein
MARKQWLATALAVMTAASAGCGGGLAVRVSDAETGKAVARARLSRGPDAPVLAVTDRDGRGTLPADAGDELWIRADGYRPWYGAISTAMAPGDPELTVALAPAWLDAFMDGRAHPRGQMDPDGTPPACHCPGRAR